MQIPGLQKLWLEKGKITVTRFELLGPGTGVSKLEVYRLNIRDAAMASGWFQKGFRISRDSCEELFSD